jgi:hypothetical protein
MLNHEDPDMDSDEKDSAISEYLSSCCVGARSFCANVDRMHQLKAY